MRVLRAHGGVHGAVHRRRAGAVRGPLDLRAVRGRRRGGAGAASPPISPAEALDRHAFVCGAGRRSTAPPSPAESADDLISALRHLLRRRLGSPPLPPPRKVRSTPSSPRRDVPTSATAIVSVDTGGGGGGGRRRARADGELLRGARRVKSPPPPPQRVVF